jgi:hypothetical protein
MCIPGAADAGRGHGQPQDAMELCDPDGGYPSGERCSAPPERSVRRDHPFAPRFLISCRRISGTEVA